MLPGQSTELGSVLCDWSFWASASAHQFSIQSQASRRAWRGHAVDDVPDVLDLGLWGGEVEVQRLVFLLVGRSFCGGGRGGELPLLLLTLGEWRELGFHAAGILLLVTKGF